MTDLLPDRPHRIDLHADCRNCSGLCCVALPFAASADFAFDKPAGEPCRNLLADCRCGIHPSLRSSGFAGCTVFDCFGAGQQVSQVIFQGRDWRADTATATEMFAVFPIVRALHELLWYLEEALTLVRAGALRRELRAALDATTMLVAAPPGELLDVDLASRRESVGGLLAQTSAVVRGTAPGRGQLRRMRRAGGDLVGAKLAHSNQQGADLRGAYLIGADLREADLRLADLLGADLRAADLHGANLSTALFLTQFQLNSARGDGSTTFPDTLTRPDHWAG